MIYRQNARKGDQEFKMNMHAFNEKHLTQTSTVREKGPMQDFSVKSNPIKDVFSVEFVVLLLFVGAKRANGNNCIHRPNN